MARVMTLQQALKIWTLTILTGVLMYTAGQLSESIVADPGSSVTLRWVAVAAAVLSSAIWMVLIAWGAALSDEFHRHVALVGTAIAFAGELLLRVGFIVMQDARLVSSRAYIPTLPSAMGLWIAGVLIAAAYYRARA